MGAMCWHEATAEAAKGRERDTVLGFSDLLKEAVGFFFSFFFLNPTLGALLAVQWLGSCFPGAMGSAPGWGARIPHCCTVWPRRKKKKVKSNS